MKEQFNGDTDPQTPEKNEDQLYAELMTVTDEQNKVIKAMGAGNVENIQKLMAQMDELEKKQTQAWEAYRDAVQKSREQEEV